MKLHLRKYISILGAGLLIFCCLSIVNAQQQINDITVTVTFDARPTDYTVSKAPLKYNKKFAVSMQSDDANSSIYNVGFPVFEGGLVNDVSYPGMKYTDGCNIDHSFKMTSSVYIFSGQGTDLLDNPIYDDYVQWSELDILFQNNWGIANHGINSDANTDLEFMNYSIARNRSYCRRKLYNSTDGGVITSVFVNPNGVSEWTEPSFELENIAALKAGGDILHSDYGGDVNLPNLKWGEEEYLINRLIIEDINVKDIVDSLAIKSVDGANYWAPMFTHIIGTQYPLEDFVSDFNYIFNTYGANGSDEILMTTDEEILDYLILRELIVVDEDWQGTNLTITFSGTIPDDLLYYATSLSINSDKLITNIEVVGTETFSISEFGSNEALVNLSWDGKIIPDPEVLAEKYVSIAEAPSSTQYDALIAMDYVYTLPPSDTKIELTNRLCNLPDLEYEDGFCDPVIDNVEIFGDTIICQGDTSYLSATAGMEYYEWSTGETSPSIKVKPSITTEYWVKGTINAVQTQDFTTVVVNPIPNIVSHSPANVNHVPGINDTLWVSTNDETLNYLWDTGSQDSSIIVDPNFTTEYYVDVLTDSGCSVRQDYIVEVLSTFDFTYDSVCLGGITHIQNISAYPDSIISITWDLNSDGVFDDAEGNEVEHQFETAGNHLVGMRLLPFEGNFEVVFQVVPVGDYPIPDFLYTNTCLPNSTNFEDQSTVIVGDIDSWFWEFGDTGTDVGSFVTHKYFSVDTYTVKLHIKSNIGCEDSISKPIEIGESPNFVVLDENNNTLYANDTTKIDKTDSLYVTIQDYENYDSIIWNNTVRDKYYYVTEEGEFSVEVYNTVCSNNEFHYLKFNTGGGGEPTTNEIMSLFTPNGDGYNDSWVVNDPSIVGNIKLNVYNRYGNSVYSSDNYNNDWQGTFDGAALPQATYYYVIEDAEGTIFKGPVTILR